VATRSHSRTSKSDPVPAESAGATGLHPAAAGEGAECSEDTAGWPAAHPEDTQVHGPGSEEECQLTPPPLDQAGSNTGRCHLLEKLANISQQPLYGGDEPGTQCFLFTCPTVRCVCVCARTPSER